MRASTKTMWYSGLIIVLVLLGISMASAIPAPDLHMPFDVNCVADISGNNHLTNITNVVGSTTAKIGNGSCYWAGQGSTSAMDVSGAVLDGASNTTITFWLRLDNQADDRDLIAKNAVNDRFTWISNVAYLQPSMKIGGGATFYSQNTSTVWTATWHHIGFTWNSTHKSYWLDGVKMNTTTVGAPFVSTGNYPMHVGWNGVNTNDKILGYVDDLCVWTDEVLVEQDFLDMWDGGTGAACNSSVPTTNYLEVTATNSYTTGEITTFNASINGTFYTTTNGTITTTIDQATASGVISVIVNATNYFSRSYSHEASTDLSAQLHQSEITFFAYNRVSGIALFSPLTNTCNSCTNIDNASDGDYDTFSSPNTNTSSYYYQNFTNANTLTVKANDKYGSGGAVANATIQAYNYSSAAWEDFIESNGTAISKAVPANYISSTYLQIRTNISSYAAGTLCVGSCVNGRFFEASAGTLTATASNNTATAARPTLNLSVATYTINFNANNYYPTSTSITTTALEQSTTNISMYDHILNVTINVLNGSVTEQNFTADVYSLDYSYHEQITTTNGEAIFNLTPGDYIVYINDSIHEFISENVTLNSSSNLTSLTIDLYSTNSINFRFIDVDTDALVDDRNVTVFITGTIESYSFITDNGSYFAELINPDTYTITYSADGYFQGERFFTLTNRTTNVLNLYLINSSESEIIATVVNDLTATVPSEIIILQKKNLSGTNYYAVDSCITSPAGSCILHANIGETTYRAILTSSSGVVHRTTNDFKFTGTTITFRVNLASNPLSFVDDIDSISSSLTQSNTSTNIIYSFTWNDASGISSFACVDVVYRIYASTNNLSTCNSASSGSFTVNESFGVAQSVCGNSYFIIDGVRFSDKTECFEILNQGVSDFGEGGLFLYITFFIGTLILSFVLVPQAPIVIPIVAGLMIVFGGWLGIIGLTSVAIGGFLVLCVLVVVVVSQK